MEESSRIQFLPFRLRLSPWQGLAECRTRGWAGRTLALEQASKFLKNSSQAGLHRNVPQEATEDSTSLEPRPSTPAPRKPQGLVRNSDQHTASPRNSNATEAGILHAPESQPEAALLSGSF